MGYALERLSELEHDQWWKMRKSLFEKIEKQFVEITGCSNPYCQNHPDQEGQWIMLRDHIEYRPYLELSDEVKEHDRKWGRKTIEIFQEVVRKSPGVMLTWCNDCSIWLNGYAAHDPDHNLDPKKRFVSQDALLEALK